MEQIEYTRTVVPSSMRSPYWKYFGFPSDNSNNILTRQKIVCIICNTIIAYNKNTSNLRTHLMSKHVEIFKKIAPISNVSVDQSRNAIHRNVEYQSNKKQCIQILDGSCEVTSLIQNKNISHVNCIDLPEYKSIESKKINCGTQSTDFIAYFPSNNTENAELIQSEENIKDGNTVYAMNEKTETYIDVDFHGEDEQQLHSMDIMLADYVQTDLLTLETLKEFGFCKYNQQLTGRKLDDDTILRVKGIIETRYMNVKQTITLHVTRLSQYKPYSLSFEIYKDNEEQDVLNIYFNYLNEKQLDLISILYKRCAIYSNDINISQLLNAINLANCSGVVVTCVDKEFQFISDFVNIHDLPVVDCLESLLSRCLKKIFGKTEFYSEYQKFLKTILEKKNVLPLAKLNLRTRSQWGPLLFLEHIFSKMEHDKIGKWDKLRESFEYLKPLKVAMEVIMDEPLPLCSLTRPLIKKLFEDHFISTNEKETQIYQIQKILEKELYERIFVKTFLKEVTFFDIRFHRDFTLKETFSEVSHLKAEILKRFKNLQVSNSDKISNVVVEQQSTETFNIRKCSSLKTFFKRDVTLINDDPGLNIKTNLDLEFEQYYNQACLDLDQSPILWWEQQADNYKQLSRLAKYYLTIPCCCVPQLCRIDLEKKYSILDRRNNLSQFCNTESKLWYLHYNEDVAKFL